MNEMISGLYVKTWITLGLSATLLVASALNAFGLLPGGFVIALLGVNLWWCGWLRGERVARESRTQIPGDRRDSCAHSPS